LTTPWSRSDTDRAENLEVAAHPPHPDRHSLIDTYRDPPPSEDAMHTFLTPEPITLEIRNASGNIQIVLSDTATTTVDIAAGTSHPLGFLDDVISALGVGRAGGRGVRRFEAMVRGRSFGHRGDLFGEHQETDSDDVPVDFVPADVTDLVRVEHRAGENPTVIVDTDPARDGWRASFQITVTAPVGTNVRVHSQSSDVTTTGQAQLLDVRTASGDVKLDEVKGKALLQTASGDVTLAVAGAAVDIRTASGNVSVGPVGGDALIHTTSGDIQLGAVGGNINARSVSGDVRVGDAVSGQAEVSAVSGDVEIGVHAGSLASINLSTVSGTTDTDFTVSGDAPEGDAPVLEITVKTTSGDIRLRRAA